MNESLWNDYLDSVTPPILNKALPVEDLLHVFKTYISLNYTAGHSTLFYNIINQIRGHIYQVPAEQFTETMAYLLEAHIDDVAAKFVPILEKLVENDQLLDVFKTDSDRTRLLWSLLLLDKTEDIISVKNMKEIVNNIKLVNLDPFHYKIFIQVLNLTLGIEKYGQAINYDQFYGELQTIGEDFKQEILYHDLSSNTSEEIRLKVKNQIEKTLNTKVKKIFEDNSKYFIIYPLGDNLETPQFEVHNSFIDDFLS